MSLLPPDRYLVWSILNSNNAAIAAKELSSKFEITVLNFDDTEKTQSEYPIPTCHLVSMKMLFVLDGPAILFKLPNGVQVTIAKGYRIVSLLGSNSGQSDAFHFPNDYVVFHEEYYHAKIFNNFDDAKAELNFRLKELSPDMLYVGTNVPNLPLTQVHLKIAKLCPSRLIEFVSKYDYTHLVFPAFFNHVTGKTVNETFMAGVVTAHLDKCDVFYVDVWKEHQIPVHHGFLLYLLSHYTLSNKDRSFDAVVKWTVDVYETHRLSILKAEFEIATQQEEV